MSEKATKKSIRSSDRTEEIKVFRAILHRNTPLRGLVIHSRGQGGTGKTTLLKMFENECQNSGAATLYFTARRPLSWQAILDKTAETIGLQHFPTYFRLRDAYADSSRMTKTRPAVVHETHIHNVRGVVHTGSGDVISASIPAPSPEQKSVVQPDETITVQGDIRVTLTNAFFQELNNLTELPRLIWLVDTTEKLDESTQSWLIDLLGRLAEDEIDDLVLVVAGRDLLCFEPYWIERIEELHIGNFDEETVLEIVQRIWATEHAALQHITAKYLMKESGGRPMDLIAHIESLNPYG